MGLPPVVGFAAKYFIFFNLFTTGYHFLVLISLLLSVLSGIYYFSLILNIWQSSKDINNFFGRLVKIEIAESPSIKSIRYISLIFTFILFFGAFLLPIDFNFVLSYFVKFIKMSNPWF